MPEAIVSGLSNGAVYGLLAVGLVLVYKGSRVLNFAQGELGGLSLFVAWWAIEQNDQPWFVGALMAMAVGASLGYLFDLVVVRRMSDSSRLSVTITTVGMTLLLLGIELVVWGPSPRVLGPPIKGIGPEILGFFVSPTRMLGTAIVVILGLGFAALFRYTDFGLGVLAASQDRVAARLTGVPLARVSSFTWTAAGFVSAVAAVLVAPTIGIFHPGLMTSLLVRALAGALVGGITSLSGAFLGGMVIGLIESLVQKGFHQFDFPGIDAVVIMLVIVIVILVRPQGILSGKK